MSLSLRSRDDSPATHTEAPSICDACQTLLHQARWLLHSRLSEVAFPLLQLLISYYLLHQLCERSEIFAARFELQVGLPAFRLLRTRALLLCVAVTLLILSSQQALRLLLRLSPAA